MEAGCPDERGREAPVGDPIPREVLPVLFDPFRRGRKDGARQRPSRGLGLGLFIVKQIVDAHGGAIEVLREASERTTFIVLIPR